MTSIEADTVFITLPFTKDFTRHYIEHGLKAHDHSSQDYRPCTLLGAIYMENHEYDLGHDWYSKARDRGAPENSINADLRSILLRLDKAKRSEMVASLLKKDPYIYGWLKDMKQ